MFSEIPPAPFPPFSGLLSLEKRNVSGKIRKYYSITDLGKNHFGKIRDYLKELYNEVMK